MGSGRWGQALLTAVAIAAAAGAGPRAASAQPAVRPSYFPMPGGASWTYDFTGPTGQKQQITSRVAWSARFGRYEWARVERFGATHNSHTFLANQVSGVVRELIPGQPSALCYVLVPGAQWRFAGQNFGLAWGNNPAECIGLEDVKVPAGVFPGCLKVEVRRSIQGGAVQQWFAPGIGLVRETGWVINRTYTVELARYRVGPRTGPRLVAEVKIAPDTVVTPGIMPPGGWPTPPKWRFDVELKVRSGTGRPETVTFATGQRYDVLIKDEQGQVLWRWADGRAFPDVLGRQTFTPAGETYKVQFEIEMFGVLGYGKRTVEAVLVASEVQPSGTAQLEVIPGV